MSRVPLSLVRVGDEHRPPTPVNEVLHLPLEGAGHVVQSPLCARCGYHPRQGEDRAGAPHTQIVQIQKEGVARGNPQQGPLLLPQRRRTQPRSPRSRNRGVCGTGVATLQPWKGAGCSRRREGSCRERSKGQRGCIGQRRAWVYRIFVERPSARWTSSTASIHSRFEHHRGNGKAHSGSAAVRGATPKKRRSSNASALSRWVSINLAVGSPGSATTGFS